jgi:O-antigen/teichoic acid export membrane protein
VWGLDLLTLSDSSERPQSPLKHTRRSPAANALLEVIGFVYPLLLTIVVTPVILHFIGTEQYGVYALALVLVGFLGLMDFGMAPVVVRFLSASLATSNHKEASAAFGVGLTFYSAVGLVGAVVAGLCGQFLPGVLSLSPDLEETAMFVMSVAGIGFFFTSLLTPVAAISGALQRFDAAIKAKLLSATAGATASVVVLWLGWGLRALIVVAALQPALTLALIARSNRRLLPTVRLRPAYKPALLKKMLSFSGYSFVSNVAGTLLFQIDKFVLGALTNASVVTYYVVPGNLAQRLHAGTARLTSVALPISTDLHARGEKEALRQFYVRATRATALVIVSLSVPAFIFAREILLEWVGLDFATTSFGTLRVLILTFAVLSLTVLPYYVTLGLGRPQVSALFNVVTAAINLVLIVVLIPRYGLIGAAVGYLVATVTVPGLILYVEHRLLELGRSPWPSLLARLSLVGVGQAICCLLLRSLSTGLPELLALLVLCVAIGPALALATGYLSPQDRAMLLRLMPVNRLRARGRVADSTID